MTDGPRPGTCSWPPHSGFDRRTLATTVKNAAIYLRVSRADQSSALQADETAELVTRRSWTLSRTYSDEGLSGATTKRPGFQQLLQDARRRRFDVLVVWRADRLFRSLRELVVTMHELEGLGIGFVSVTEPFDTTTPSGRLLLQLVGAFAEFERQVLIERTRSGLAAAKRRGKQLGRPPRAFNVDRALELRQRGRSIRAIASELGVPIATIHRRLAG
jgi:DNA invertase Pin-like site-specific DNA recombinase